VKSTSSPLFRYVKEAAMTIRQMLGTGLFAFWLCWFLVVDDGRQEAPMNRTGPDIRNATRSAC
jgi:hypothetical protein